MPSMHRYLNADHVVVVQGVLVITRVGSSSSPGTAVWSFFLTLSWNIKFSILSISSNKGHFVYVTARPCIYNSKRIQLKKICHTIWKICFLSVILRRCYYSDLNVELHVPTGAHIARLLYNCGGWHELRPWWRELEPPHTSLERYSGELEESPAQLPALACLL